MGNSTLLLILGIAIVYLLITRKAARIASIIFSNG